MVIQKRERDNIWVRGRIVEGFFVMIFLLMMTVFIFFTVWSDDVVNGKEINLHDKIYKCKKIGENKDVYFKGKEE